MNFKYQRDYINLLPEICPPENYVPFNNEVAYRWVFDEITNPENFVPQYHKNPKRFNNWSDKEKCKAMALSMFNTLENATNRFNAIKLVTGDKVYKTLGCNIAKGQIITSDGVNSEIDEKGHFNHHSSIETDYLNKFIIIEKL